MASNQRSDSGPSDPGEDRVLRFGEFRFRLRDGVLERDGADVPIPPRGVAVLRELVQRPDEIVSKDDLMEACWPDTVVSEHSVNEAVKVLRELLGDDPRDPQFIQTVHRRGYRFIAPVRVERPDSSGQGPPAGDRRRGAERSASAPAAGTRRSPRTPLLGWVIERRSALGWAAVAVVALIVGLLAGRSMSGAGASGERGDAGARRLSIVLPETARLAPEFRSPTLAISRDGRRLVYVGRRDDDQPAGGSPILYLRSLDRSTVEPIPGTEGAATPFLSPSGDAVAFFADGHLKLVHLAGGSGHVLATAPHGGGGDFLPDGGIVYSPGPATGLRRVSADGGEPVILTRPDSRAGELAHLWPHVLPGGEAVLFTVWSGTGVKASHLAVLDLESGRYGTVVEGGTYGRYLRSGHLLFARDGELATVPFDVGRRRAEGEPRTVLEDALTVPTNGAAQIAVAEDGTLVYVAGRSPFPETRILEVGRGGEAVAVLEGSGRYYEIAGSPDGERLAVTVQHGSSFSLSILDLSRGTLSRLTLGGRDYRPVWTPDGLQVTFASARAGEFAIVQQAANSSAPREVLWSATEALHPDCWTPDGRGLLVTWYRRRTRSDLGILWPDEKGPSALRELLRTRFHEGGGRFSPDGRWVAYHSDESDRFEVYVRRVREGVGGLGAKFQVSTSGGVSPRWKRDGTELYYRGGDGVYAVEIEAGERFDAGRPRLLFEGDFLSGPNAYAVGRGGRSFYVIEARPMAPVEVLEVVERVQEADPSPR